MTCEPLLDRRAEPDTSGRKHSLRFGEIGFALDELVHPLPGHSEHFGDLSNTHKLLAHRGNLRLPLTIVKSGANLSIVKTAAPAVREHPGARPRPTKEVPT